MRTYGFDHREDVQQLVQMVMHVVRDRCGEKELKALKAAARFERKYHEATESWYFGFYLFGELFEEGASNTEDFVSAVMMTRCFPEAIEVRGIPKRYITHEGE